MKKYVKWGLVIFWMILIFAFSAKPAVESDKQSYFIIYLLNSLGISLESAFGTLANFAVRKVGHFTEYCIFYILLYNAFREHYGVKKSLIFALISVFLYACTDEFHQSFVPGRTSRFRDVIIDTFGGTFGGLIMWLSNKSAKS